MYRSRNSQVCPLCEQVFGQMHRRAGETTQNVSDGCPMMPMSLPIQDPNFGDICPNEECQAFFSRENTTNDRGLPPPRYQYAKNGPMEFARTDMAPHDQHWPPPSRYYLAPSFTMGICNFGRMPCGQCDTAMFSRLHRRLPCDCSMQNWQNSNLTIPPFLEHTQLCPGERIPQNSLHNCSIFHVHPSHRLRAPSPPFASPFNNSRTIPRTSYMDRNYNPKLDQLWMSVPQYPYQTPWDHAPLPLAPPPPRCQPHCVSPIIPNDHYAVEQAHPSPMRNNSSLDHMQQHSKPQIYRGNARPIIQCMSQETVNRFGVESVASPELRNLRTTSDHRMNGNSAECILHRANAPHGASAQISLSGLGLQCMEEAEWNNRQLDVCNEIRATEPEPQKVDTAIPSIRAEKGSEKCDSIRSSDSDSPRIPLNGCKDGEMDALNNLNHVTLANFLELPAGQLEYVDIHLFNRALLDCYGRFLLNLPASLLRDHVHLQFQIQEGHWWYEDFWYDAYPEKLPKINLKAFGLLMCDSFGTLRECVPKDVRGRLLKDWVLYCKTIPLRGAIILNATLSKCLLVQGWKGNRWTFPRGKVDEQESDETCAIREVLEEIGFDVSNMISKELFIEKRLGKQCVKLFIICGVSEETTLGPQKRKEISEIRWVPVASLPDNFKTNNIRNTKGQLRGGLKNRNPDNGQTGGSATSNGKIRFTHVAGFVPGILEWLKVLKSRLNEFNGRLPNDATLFTSHLEWAHLRRLQHPDGFGDANDPEDEHGPGDDREGTARSDQGPPSGADSPENEPQQDADELSHTANDLLAVLLRGRTDNKSEIVGQNARRSSHEHGNRPMPNIQNNPQSASRARPSKSDASTFKPKAPAMRSIGVSAINAGYGEKTPHIATRKKGAGKQSPLSQAKNLPDRSEGSHALPKENQPIDMEGASTFTSETGPSKAPDEKPNGIEDKAANLSLKQAKKSNGDQFSLDDIQPGHGEPVSPTNRKDYMPVRTKVKLLSRSPGDATHNKVVAKHDETGSPVTNAGTTTRSKLSTSRPLTILKRGDKV